MEHGYNVQIDIQQAIHHPWLSQMFVYQTYHFRIGAQMLLAFVTSVFGVEFSLELFSNLLYSLKDTLQLILYTLIYL